MDNYISFEYFMCIKEAFGHCSLYMPEVQSIFFLSISGLDLTLCGQMSVRAGDKNHFRFFAALWRCLATFQREGLRWQSKRKQFR